MNTQNYKVLDLFSGAGGMSEGFLQAGFEVSNAADHSIEAATTYQNRHKQLGYEEHKFFQGDIKALTKPKFLKEFLNGNEISVVVGGPPCQGFSMTGKRAGDDPRNYLFMDYMKIVKLTKPKYFVIENVEGILSFLIDKIVGVSGEVHENKLVPQIIVEEAWKMGYSVKYRLLNAKNYGVPQNRPRVIFLGHKIKKRRNRIQDVVAAPQFPIPSTTFISVKEAISDLSFLKSGEIATEYDSSYINSEYQRFLKQGLTPDKNGKSIRSNNITNHVTSRHNENVSRRFELLKVGESIGELLTRLHQTDLEKLNTKKYRCRKLHEDHVSPTVLTLPDDIIHYECGNSRILTVRELARIQSFDDSFEFLGKRTTGGERRKYETPQYTQVGNAVPPLFAKAIASEIYKALKKSELGGDQNECENTQLQSVY